jgi:predicted glycosyltransferase
MAEVKKGIAPMRILCDINHPADIHLFKNALWRLQENGHEYLITARDKEVTLQLLDEYNFPYVAFGKHYSSMTGKIYGMFKFNTMMYQEVRRFKPDILLSSGSIYAAHVSALIHKPHISMEDTENSYEQIIIYRPFTDVILTSTSFERELGKKQIRYNGYHELAYLLPRYFTPDQSILKILGVHPQDHYVVLRFVSRGATHDIARKGISRENKIKTVGKFSRYAKVFISSEDPLPPELKQYQLSIEPHRMHDVLYYATMLYGESATMASECAILGTPAIFIDDDGRGYTNDEERYGLVYNFTESIGDQERSIEKGVELLQQPRVKAHFRERLRNLIRDKIDVTKFMVWFIEKYPESAAIMKKNSLYDKQVT